ncbi:MAG: hypothetical protein AB2L17_17145 [Lentimicrobium sp.]
MTTRPADLASRQSLFTGLPVLHTAPPSLTKAFSIQYQDAATSKKSAKQTVFTLNQNTQ